MIIAEVMILCAYFLHTPGINKSAPSRPSSDVTVPQATQHQKSVVSQLALILREQEFDRNGELAKYNHAFCIPHRKGIQ